MTTIPPITSFPSLISTGVALLFIGSSIKVAQIFSTFLSKTIFETGASYAIGYLVGALSDKITPDTSPQKKIIAVHLCMLASGYFIFKISLASIASAAIVLTFQSNQQDSLLSFSNLRNGFSRFQDRFFPSN